MGVGKTAQNIHDRNLLKQTLQFIKSFNEKQIREEKLKNTRKNLVEVRDQLKKN